MEKEGMPVLVPMELEAFWEKMREIVRCVIKEIVIEGGDKVVNAVVPIMETPGLTEKPLYRIAEICLLFNITRPTLDAWIADKKLRRVKIRGKVYFIGSEVRGLMEGK